MTALNPVMSIGNQIDEIFRYHVSMSRSERIERAIELLRDVNLPNPEQIMNAVYCSISNDQNESNNNEREAFESRLFLWSSNPMSWAINHLSLDAWLSLTSRGVPSPNQRYNQRETGIFLFLSRQAGELPLNWVHCPDIFVILSDNVCPLVKGCLGYTFMT